MCSIGRLSSYGGSVLMGYFNGLHLLVLVVAVVGLVVCTGHFGKVD